MTFDPSNRMAAPEEDAESAGLRNERLHAMGIGDQPYPELDAIADKLREITGASYAMVNFVIDGRQYFAGLSTPSGPQTLGNGSDPGREMELDQGFCPHVVSRGTALPLADVCAYPRFAGNRVVDELGVRTYLGAPVKDPASGVTLGTVCVIDTEPIPWTKEDVENIKGVAEQVTSVLQRRERDGG
ncbi:MULTISPECIES: GAF domain-containing protein [unclassified Streptomyces]|uniref:GAF domain-containing protein n=1 Tax=unclassified Streptomyces TaxID=2593676 RepID=UPI002E281A16|nr:GAF domain-containing protein [Streptomyces sp. NBC_00223]